MQIAKELIILGVPLYIVNDNIIVGVEKPHKLWMCRQPRNMRQNSIAEG
jgi:hypothetical protein